MYIQLKTKKYAQLQTLLFLLRCSLFALQMVPFWPKETSCQMMVKAERDEKPNVQFSYAETSSFLLHTVMLSNLTFILSGLANDCMLYIFPHSHQL